MMPATSFPEYVRSIEHLLEQLVSTGEVVLLNLQVDQRSSLQGLIVGSLQFDKGDTLHFREFVNLRSSPPKLADAYYFQDEEARLIFRYDNAVHRPSLPQLEHKHTSSSVAFAPAPTLAEVLTEILKPRNLG